MSNRKTFGIIAFILGVIWLLANFDLLDLPGFLGVLSIILIALGAWQLVGSNFTKIGGPTVLLVSGIILGLAELDLIRTLDIWRAFFPMILILIGATSLFGKKKGNSDSNIASSHRISSLNIFGGGKIVNASKEFQGGEIVDLFGGGNIDLKNAEIKDKPASLEITILFGGSELKLPESWSVQNQTIALFGGSDDKRDQAKVSTKDSESDLVITGIIIFGGLDIR